MTELLALTAAGSALLSLTIFLLLLRTEIGGRRPALALTRRWVAATSTTSAFVLASLISSAGLAIVLLSTLHPDAASQDAGVMDESPAAHAAFEQDEDMSALRTFADSLDGAAPAESAQSAVATNLPAVDQMIETLRQRLEREPGDVRGWKMLAWSYLNTGRPDQAEQAYETALRLAPTDSEIMAALRSVRAAKSAPAASGPDKR
jgi:cytochrome c-type biogenesis protein CcmH